MSKIIEVKGGDTTLRVGAGWLSIESKAVDAAYRLCDVKWVNAESEESTQICCSPDTSSKRESILTIPIKFSDVMRAIREGS